MTKLEKSLIITLAGVILSAGMAWGRLTYQVAEDNRRIAKLEDKTDELAKVAAQMVLHLMYGGGNK